MFKNDGGELTAINLYNQLEKLTSMEEAFFLPWKAASTTTEEIELSWAILPHLKYSPDLAPNDYLFFLIAEKLFDGENIL